jgi:hypothetical protein
MKFADWGLLYYLHSIRFTSQTRYVVLKFPALRDQEFFVHIVIALYTKGGGKNGKHGAVPSVSSVAAIWSASFPMDAPPNIQTNNICYTDIRNEALPAFAFNRSPITSP